MQPGSPSPWHLAKGVENLCLHKKSYKQMFIATSFIIAKTWKQLRCSSAG